MNEATVVRDDRRAIVRPSGDVVAASVPELRSTMKTALSGGIQELVIDLRDVHMVDSSGIGLLISAHNSMRKAGGRLTLIHTSGEVLDLLRTMRIHQHFSITGD